MTQKLIPLVNKFVGYYKQIVTIKKIESFETYIISTAYDIYYHDEYEKFSFESER